MPWAIVALAVLRGPEDGVPRAFAVGTPNPITTVDFGVAPGGSERPPFTGKGVYYLKHRLPGTPSAHDPALATYGVGAPSYSLGPDTYVLDLFGLGDPMTSHLELEQRATVAHEKPLPRPWIPARLLKPGSPVTQDDLQLPPLFFARSLDDPRGESFSHRVRDARRATALHAARGLLRDVPRAARRRTVLRQPRCVVHQLRVPHPARAPRALAELC